MLREGSLEGEGVRRLRRGEKKAGKEKKRNIEGMIREWGQGKDETWEKVEGSKGERGICAKDTEEQEK